MSKTFSYEGKAFVVPQNMLDVNREVVARFDEMLDRINRLRTALEFYSSGNEDDGDTARRALVSLRAWENF